MSKARILWRWNPCWGSHVKLLNVSFQLWSLGAVVDRSYIPCACSIFIPELVAGAGVKSLLCATVKGVFLL